MIHLKRSSHWYLLDDPIDYRWQVHKLLSLCFVLRSTSPQQFLYTHIRELTFHPSAEQRQWDEPDHEKPHPTKMLRSKYLNCS